MNVVSIGRSLASRPIAALLVILLLALALRLGFFVGPTGTDEYSYAQSAYNLTKGVYRISGRIPHQEARLALIVPLALSFQLFGVSEWASALWPLLCSLGSVVVAFYVGRELFNVRAGLLAALLLSFFPVEVLLATRMLPDSVQPFLIGLSVLFFLKGQRAASNRTVYLYFTLCNLLVGIAFLARESALIIVPFFLAYSIYARSRGKEYVIALTSLICSLALPGLIFLGMRGTPFPGIKFYVGALGIGTPEYFVEAINRYGAWSFAYSRMLFARPEFVFFAFFAFVSLAYLLCVRDKKAYIPVLWFMTVFLYMEFIWPLHNRKLPRYLSLLSIPWLLIIARFLAVLATHPVGLWRPATFIRRLTNAGGELARSRRVVLISHAGTISKWVLAVGVVSFLCGISFFVLSILFSPSFVVDHLSPDAILEPKTVQLIENTRIVLRDLGTILMAASLLLALRGANTIAASLRGSHLHSPLPAVDAAAARVTQDWGRTLLVGLIIGFLFTTSISRLTMAAPKARHVEFRFRQAARVLEALPERDIYVPMGPTLWRTKLNFHLGFDTGYNLFGLHEENTDSMLRLLPETGWERIEDSYVVLDPWIEQEGRWLIGEVAAVPDWWQELTRITYEGADTVIYYTGSQPSP